MAVLDSNQTVSNNVSGFDKGIHASARTMMLDNLQGTMYQRPVDSAVRECVSNAVDAVREKNVAKQIKSGKAKVGDYYLSREDVKDRVASEEDDIYQDSEFDPDYYDLNWLDSSDTITLQYIVKGQTERDQFIIKDSGVGLGGKRLEGFFSLGYSSKRLNTGELGGFGLGAKSPLATGVESYRMISCYNGKEFCFDIYSHKVDCVYGKWNDEGGGKNDFVEFKSVMVPEKYMKDILDEKGVVTGQEEAIRMVPYKAYYKNTTAKNSTSIIIDVKKHNRNKFHEAVKSQLMYLDNDIIFEEVNGPSKTKIPFKAEIIYEDENIILPRGGYYTRPHFVIKRIAYGLIDFNEADLAQKYGNAGLKFNMESLKVLPTREGVQYESKTNNAIVETYTKVAATVEARITDALRQEDFVDWVLACNQVMYSANAGNSDDVTKRLAEFGETNTLSPVWVGDKDVKFFSDTKSLFPGMTMTHVELETTYDYSVRKNKTKIKRSDISSIQAFNKPMYFQFGPGSSKTTMYLSNLHKPDGGFIVFKLVNGLTYLDPHFDSFVNGKLTLEELSEKCINDIDTLEVDATKRKNLKLSLEKTMKIVSYLRDTKSKKKIQVYSEKLVPEGYKYVVEEDDTVVDDGSNEELLAQQRLDKYKELIKRRKENKAFVAYKLANKKVSNYYYKSGYERFELKSAELDYDSCRIIKATDEDDLATTLLIELAKSRGSEYDNEHAVYYWDDDLKIVKVSKTNLKYVKEAESVESFMLEVDDDGVLRSTDLIRKALTARSVGQIVLEKCKFLRNFDNINPQIAKSYDKLRKYLDDAPNYALIENGTGKYCAFYNEYYKVNLTFLNVESITEDERTELLDGCTTNVFDLDIVDIDLIDKDIYLEAKRLAAFADVYGGILGYIGPLRSEHKRNLNQDLVTELKGIIESKKDQLEFEYEGINK